MKAVLGAKALLAAEALLVAEDVHGFIIDPNHVLAFLSPKQL